MAIDVWAVLTLTAKWLVYLGTAAAIGGPFALALLARSGVASRTLGYSLGGCALGGFAAVAAFFFQVGSFVGQGVAGMFDPTYLNILWQSAVGEAVLVRVIGFCLVAGGLAWLGRRFRRGLPVRGLASAPLLVILLGVGVLAASYPLGGHTVEGGPVARAALFFHVVAMGLWAGSLYPLWLACKTPRLAALQEAMAAYGKLAAGFVALLVTCGVALGFVLLADFAALATTAYGVGLLVKLVLVLAMLAIAAGNKWIWVAALRRQGNTRCLSRSVAVELAVALLIMLTTAYVTTWVGPIH